MTNLFGLWAKRDSEATVRRRGKEEMTQSFRPLAYVDDEEEGEVQLTRALTNHLPVRVDLPSDSMGPQELRTTGTTGSMMNTQAA